MGLAAHGQSSAGLAAHAAIAAFARRRADPFQLDSRPPSIKPKDYVYNETRYTMLAKSNPDEAHRLLDLAQQDVLDRWKIYENMVHMPIDGTPSPPVAPAAKPAAQEVKQ